jgi:hypothetical protein
MGFMTKSCKPSLQSALSCLGEVSKLPIAAHAGGGRRIGCSSCSQSDGLRIYRSGDHAPLAEAKLLKTSGGNIAQIRSTRDRGYHFRMNRRAPRLPPPSKEIGWSTCSLPEPKCKSQNAGYCRVQAFHRNSANKLSVSWRAIDLYESLVFLMGADPVIQNY